MRLLYNPIVICKLIYKNVKIINKYIKIYLYLINLT